MSAVPPFWCPPGLPARCNPAAARCEQQVRAWCDEVGISPRYATVVRPAQFMARFAPTAPPERLLPAACGNAWGFAFDDHLDTPLPQAFPVVVAAVQRALATPEPPRTSDTWCLAANELGRRLRRLATPAQHHRFVEAHRAWLFAACWRHGNHATGRLPSLDEYVHLREPDSAGEVVFHLVALAEGIGLREEELHAPATQALLRSAVTVLILDNDRHSFRKEDRERPRSQHLFSVLQHQRHLDPEEALHQGVALRDRILAQCLRLHGVVVAGASAALRGFADTIVRGVRANLDWAAENTRYGQTPRTFAFTDTPADTRAEPPEDLPSIAWWWRV